MGDYQQLSNDDRDDRDDRERDEVPGRKKRELFGYPTQVYFILGNEFCERFSYYGMHAILVIYLMSMLKMTKDDATAVYHAFNMLCYFSPIFGAIIADSFWGKYKTILYISLIYALGNVVVSFTAVPSILSSVQLYGPAIGLVLIAIGTGGIKPCVSAFGGDQFESGQEEKLQSFFSIFYFAINCGSLIATLLTPVLRADVHCFGYDCYPLAFGVPAILMILSLLLFVSGSNWYKKVPPEGNVVVKVSSAVGNAIKNRISHCGSGIKKDHWIEWASDKYSSVLKSDIKALFKVLFMFLPLPVFWTLFDQQGSRWTLQAIEMNGDIGWMGTTIKPDQMQALNPVFVMILIPFAETVVYPLMKMCGVLTKPLQRMGTGMFLVAISFVIAGYLQLKMEAKSTVATLPPTGYANYRIINTVPCDIGVFSEEFKTKNLTIPYQHGTEYFSVPTKLKHISVNSQCPPRMTLDQDVKVKEKNSYTLVIGANHSRLATTQLEDDVTTLGHTRSKVRFLHVGGSVTDAITIKLNKTLLINLTPFSNPEYISIISKSYHVRAAANGTADALALKRIIFGKGGIYTVVIQPNKKLDGLQFFVYEDVSPRPICILWQIPQYLVITLGEVMFSITGLEFAYSQSPPSMKSCIMAAWLLTVSVGNLLVVILAGVKLTEDMAKEFFFFAGLLGVVTVIFAIMAWFYKYVNYGCVRSSDESYDDEDNVPLLSKSDPEEQVPSMKIHRPVAREVVQEQSEIVKSGLENNSNFYGAVDTASQQQNEAATAPAVAGQQQVSELSGTDQGNALAAQATLDQQQSAGIIDKYDMSSGMRLQSLQGKSFTVPSSLSQQPSSGYGVTERQHMHTHALPSANQYHAASSGMGMVERKDIHAHQAGSKDVLMPNMYTQGDLGTPASLRQRYVATDSGLVERRDVNAQSQGSLTAHAPSGYYVERQSSLANAQLQSGGGYEVESQGLHTHTHATGLGGHVGLSQSGGQTGYKHAHSGDSSGYASKDTGYGLVESQAAHTHGQSGALEQPSGYASKSTGYGLVESQAAHTHSQSGALEQPSGYASKNTGYGLVESQAAHTHSQSGALEQPSGYASKNTGYGLVESQAAHSHGQSVSLDHSSEYASKSTGYGLVENQTAHSHGQTGALEHPTLAQEIASSTGMGYLVAERTSHPGGSSGLGYDLVEKHDEHVLERDGQSHTLGVTGIESGLIIDQHDLTTHHGGHAHHQKDDGTPLLPAMHIERLSEEEPTEFTVKSKEQ